MAWFVALLLVTEIGLQATVAMRGVLPGLPEDRRIHLVVGTSRSERALIPEEMEHVLAESGLAKPFTAVATRQARTALGVAELYSEEIATRIGPHHQLGVLAIEVRASGLNDSYVRMDEIGFVWPVTGVLTSLGYDVTLRAFFGQFFIADLKRASQRLALERPPWLGPGHGWHAFDRPSPSHKRESLWRRRYVGHLLVGYSIGELQTEALEHLVDRAREDGFTPILFVPPVTTLHRSFFAPGDYDAFRAHVADFANRKNISLYDFDAVNDFESAEFWDTNHLSTEGAQRFSRCFAREVLSNGATANGARPSQYEVGFCNRR